MAEFLAGRLAGGLAHLAGGLVYLARGLVYFAACLGEADFYHLPRVIPFVDGRGNVQSFVALQPHQPALQGAGENFRDLGLADAGFAFEKQRPLHLQGEEQGGGEAALGDVVGAREQRRGLVYRLRQFDHFSQYKGACQAHGTQRFYTFAHPAFRAILAPRIR